MDLRDLAGLAAEIYERSRSDLPDEDPARAFEDRAVRLVTTFQGAGVLTGDLTPECAAVVSAVLDALSAPAGAEDDRTQGQRYHDALQEAMRRLVAADLLPERAGQPVKVWAHISLADLLRLDGSSALQEEWTAQVRAQWAAHRAEASGGGSDGGAWLDGAAAEAIACDAAHGPDRHRRRQPGRAGGPGPAVRRARQAPPRRRQPGNAAAGGDAAAAAGGEPGTPGPDTGPAREALERAIIGKAVDLLSGPGGLASLPAPPAARRPPRRPQPAAGHRVQPRPSRPGSATRSSCGTSTASGPGRCDQPAAACQVHHTEHKANGGPTSVKDCVLLCWFHHQVVIHRWGWTLVLNPDGTTTAWNKDKTKVLHSHSPPARAG